MLKQLKIKFVAVIMSVFTVLFAAIFGFVMHLTKQNIERDSIEMMRTVAFRPPDSDPMHSKPDKPPNSIRLPVFTITISKHGTLVASGSDFFDLTDQAALQTLVDIAEQSKEPSGIIAEYDLRFLKNEFRNMKSIVFADISSEKAMLRGLIRNFILIGLIGYAVFFVISLLLAKWMTRPVEKTWNAQKQFIADASHELKTPLTIIMTNAEMMEDQSYSDSDRTQFTSNILATSKRMRVLVESLLELARFDNAQTRIQHESVDLSKLINDSVLPFEPLFYENDMVLATEIAPNIIVGGDKEKLRQVITILLDNALKYSDPAGQVTVGLKRQAANSVLFVSGRGAAISKADCVNIFKRFYRLDASRNDGQSYGLGLSIAESIVHEHSGKVWAESENGVNTFYVLLPC